MRTPPDFLHPEVRAADVEVLFVDIENPACFDGKQVQDQEDQSREVQQHGKRSGDAVTEGVEHIEVPHAAQEHAGGEEKGVQHPVEGGAARENPSVHQHPGDIQHQGEHDAVDRVAETDFPHLLIHVAHALPDDDAQHQQAKGVQFNMYRSSHGFPSSAGVYLRSGIRTRLSRLFWVTYLL